MPALAATQGFKIKRSKGDLVFSGVVYCLLVLITLAMVVPVLQVVSLSLSPASEAGRLGLHLWPSRISFDGYSRVFAYSLVWRAYWNTLVRTGLGVGLNILLLILGAYPLAKGYLPNRRLWTIFVIITMYFSGGLIPSYVLISKYLGLRDTIWALVLPTAVSGYNLVVVRNFFMAIPESLEESARLDGANEFSILFRIIVPLSKPVLATVTLWCIVNHWNAWFDCMLYIDTQTKFVLQLVLRQILLAGSVQEMVVMAQEYVNTETMRMASVVVSTLPVLCIYPFLQKYFVKGVMMGAVKG